MSGGVFKRCGCRSSETGRLLSSACPEFIDRGHGSWYFDCAVPVLPGRRERLRRGGYPTRREAIAARDTLLGDGDTATAEDLIDMIITIGATTNRYARAPTPSTLHRIRATLRSALYAAIREGLLRHNPARYVEVSSPRRSHALVWTAQRVEAWQKTGERLAVAVWTVEQTATFLS